MTNAEWKKLFTRLRTLRWLVRMKDKHRDTIAETHIGLGTINYSMMSSHRQRKQFQTTMNDLGEILHGMEGGNMLIRDIIYTLICGVWKVNTFYPNQIQVFHEAYNKQMGVWEKFHTGWEARRANMEIMGRAIPMLDKIIDSKPKEYTSQIMMLKLSL